MFAPALPDDDALGTNAEDEAVRKGCVLVSLRTIPSPLLGQFEDVNVSKRHHDHARDAFLATRKRLRIFECGLKEALGSLRIS